MSEGLLLLTNEGDLANRLLHPSAEVAKRYEVGLVAPAPDGLVRRLLEGVELEDGRAVADSATLKDGKGAGPVLTLTLHEGRNREVRRMLDAVGARIRYLKRVAFGPVELSDLPSGAWRELGPEERGALGDTVEERRG
jgi:23S rRNA pseudouridine2605 synthase